MTDEIAKSLGFGSAEEFHRMVAGADISTPEQRAAFKLWQDTDGTKDGLMKLSVPPARTVTTIWSFGAGTDSTGGICGMVERGEPIHHITFSDPGGEVPRVYAHIERFSAWLQGRGYPPVTVLRRKAAEVAGMGTALTLEAECLLRGQLPGIAYGFKSCSDKWKMQPFRAWLAEQSFTDAVVCIGYDANEQRRADRAEQHAEGYTRRFPLIEWGWDRDACVAAIERAGLPLPGKSACFFCPSSKKHEIIRLKAEHPDLLARALRIERCASVSNDTKQGLGGRFAWEDVIHADEAQLKLLPDVTNEVPCGCFDGEDA